MACLACALLFVLSGCEGAGLSPVAAGVSGSGDFAVAADGRWLLVMVDGEGSADAHWKAHGEPVYLARAELEDGVWTLFDLTGGEPALELPAPPAPWPAKVHDLGLRHDAWFAARGITFEEPPAPEAAPGG